VGVHHVLSFVSGLTVLSYWFSPRFESYTYQYTYQYTDLYTLLDMVSYDDHEEVQSDLNFDFSVFDKPDNEWASIQTMEDEETLVDCQAEAPPSDEEGMEVDIDSQGVAPSQV
jgi:hypothetical protein